MAITVNQYFSQGTPAAWIPGTEVQVVAEMVGDSSYTSGGYAIAGVLPFSTLRMLIPINTNLGLLSIWDQVNQKIKVFYPTGGATAAPTSVSATAKSTTGASTASAVNATTPDITPGVAVEVGATTNLTTLKIYCLIYGRV
jgi:hypothetical protein